MREKDKSPTRSTAQRRAADFRCHLGPSLPGAFAVALFRGLYANRSLGLLAPSFYEVFLGSVLPHSDLHGGRNHLGSVCRHGMRTRHGPPHGPPHGRGSGGNAKSALIGLRSHPINVANVA